jgi:hypothetical protein
MTTEQEEATEPIGKIVGGQLDLSGAGLTSLSFIGVQPSLKALIISNNQITSFKTLPPQPNLKIIFAGGNPITEIDGLDNQSRLEAIDLSDTPISRMRKYRIRVLATCPNLVSLNGDEFTAQERQHAKRIKSHYPDQQIISDEEKQKMALTEENKMLQFKMYVEHHKDQFSDFARNEAELWDLKNNGQLPIITEYSSDEELKRAIVILRRRNAKIYDTFLKE